MGTDNWGGCRDGKELCGRDKPYPERGKLRWKEIERATVSATMEEQIQKAQEKVIKTKAAYDAADESLQKLLDKRDAQRKHELWDVIIKSKQSYEEILRYVAEGPDTGEKTRE